MLEKYSRRAMLLGAAAMAGVVFAAFAQEHEGGKGGDHGSGKGKGKEGHGPNPNCPYQDHSGRGGFGPGKAGHQGSTPGANPHVSTTSSDPGITGGGAGGEGFVCDAPAGRGVVDRVFRR